MRLAPTKTPEQQSCLMLHRTRHLFIRHQTAILNTIRAHLAEFGIVAPVGRNGVEDLLYAVADQRDDHPGGRACVWHLSNAMSMLDELPGVGPALARILVRASVADPKAFRSGRDFSAWVGLVPKQTPAAAERSSAASPSREIAICARSSPQALWP